VQNILHENEFYLHTFSYIFILMFWTKSRPDTEAKTTRKCTLSADCFSFSQIAMEDLLSDYKSLCHEREDVCATIKQYNTATLLIIINL